MENNRRHRIAALTLALLLPLSAVSCSLEQKVPPENTEVATTAAPETERTPEPVTEPVTEPHVHEYGEWTTTEATCTKDGVKLRYCECGEEERETIPATGHSLGDWYEAVAPTEEKLGEYRRDCDNCNHFETVPIPSLAHSHGRWETVTLPAVEPTCTETGLTEGSKCGKCGEALVMQMVIPTAGHAMGDWSETVAPTEDAAGEKRRDCANCDHFETEIVAPLAHDHSRWETVTLPAVEPTCTETGLTEGSKCGKCGEILVAQNTIPVTEHNYQPAESMECVCSDCSDTIIVTAEFEITSSNREKIGCTGKIGEKLVIPAVIQDGGAWYRVTRIGDGAFRYCSGLTSVTIPDSVTCIDYGAFSYCTSLTDIYYTGTEAEWNAIAKGSAWDYNTPAYTLHFNHQP